MIFQNPQFFWLLVLLPFLVLLWVWRGRAQAPVPVLALRLLIVSLLIGALANPIIAAETPQDEQLIVLVDQSDSLEASTKQALQQQAQQLAIQAPEQVRILYFGANTSDSISGKIGGQETDLEQALRSAADLLTQQKGRVLLLSDGQETRGDVLHAAQELNLPIDTFAVATPESNEAWIESMAMPRTLRESEEYALTITIGSTLPQAARLRIFDDQQQLLETDLQLPSGWYQHTINLRAGNPGIVRLRAELEAVQDRISQNNYAAATAQVAPTPQVLLVEGQNASSATLRNALRAAGIDTQTTPAAFLPSQLSQLGGFEGIVLIDVPAGDLSFEQMATLREFVRSEGNGLVATGGRSSFTVGSYKGTPLEEVLPISMDPPPRPQRSEVSLLLVIDHSYSMASFSGISKLDMAKEAAILATDTLNEEDRVGVLTFDERFQWTVPFQQVGTGLELAMIQEGISSIPIGGGTDIFAALQASLPVLAEQPTQVRHAVLLTDGRSFESGNAAYRDLIEQARLQNITLSAIAIGQDSDINLLQQLAQWGAGRYHYAASPSDIPRLTLLESEIARAEPLIEAEFKAQDLRSHALLRGFVPNDIPPLQGYVATTIKPNAELVLESHEGDPILAAWQYGLGRAVAWTPTLEEPWANSWGSWHDFGRFWAQIIRYTLPEPDSGPLQIRASVDGSVLTLIADSVLESGKPLNFVDTTAQITLPDQSVRRVTMHQIAPGQYQSELILPSDGAYAIEVQQQSPQVNRSARIGFVQQPAGEYRVRERDGAALLEQLSTLSGGNVLDTLDTVVAPSSTNQPQVGLWIWPTLLAALLWLAELAVRRRLWWRY